MYNRLLAAKSSTFIQIGSATQTVLNILQEINTHKAFCHSFGVTQEELQSTPESTATTAYGAYIIDTGVQGTYSTLACRIGVDVAVILYRRQHKAIDGAPCLPTGLWRGWTMAEERGSEGRILGRIRE